MVRIVRCGRTDPCSIHGGSKPLVTTFFCTWGAEQAGLATPIGHISFLLLALEPNPARK